MDVLASYPKMAGVYTALSETDAVKNYSGRECGCGSCADLCLVRSSGPFRSILTTRPCGDRPPPSVLAQLDPLWPNSLNQRLTNPQSPVRGMNPLSDEIIAAYNAAP